MRFEEVAADRRVVAGDVFGQALHEQVALTPDRWPRNPNRTIRCGCPYFRQCRRNQLRRHLLFWQCAQCHKECNLDYHHPALYDDRFDRAFVNNLVGDDYVSDDVSDDISPGLAASDRRHQVDRSGGVGADLGA